MNEQSAKPRWFPANLAVAGTLLFLAGAAAGVARESSTASERLDARDLAHHLIAKAGTSHGLCSLLGCRDGTLALEILRGSQFFLHVQDPRQMMVAGAAKALDTDGLYGTRVLVERQPLNSLLFADNTVDLVLALLDRGATEQGTDASGDLASLSIQEIVRVLRPGGRAILGTAKDAKQPLTQRQLSQWISGGLSAQIDVKFGQDAFGSWAEITKRQPKGMDAWSHWEHGPDNNPVSTDSVIKAPYRTQWPGGPLYSAMPAITTAAGGRIFTALGHIAHHRREEPWLNMLLARNGYNGTFLWSRKLPDGYLVHRSAFVAAEDYFYLIDNDGCLRLDPETGRQIDRIHVPEVEGERSCARLTATPDSFFCRGWPEGLTRCDRSTGVISFNGAMRPACNDGIIAANGMLYLGPWLCDCNLSLMATFGLCSAGEFRVKDEDPVSQRLEVSEAGNSVVPFPEISVEDWPTYRAASLAIPSGAGGEADHDV